MVSNIKNDYIDFDVYPGAAVFSEFKKQFGVSLEKLLQDDPTNAEAFAFAVFTGHVSYCKIKGVDPKVSADDIVNKMTFEELANALAKVLPQMNGEQKKMKK
jgi:hypothetical protein